MRQDSILLAFGSYPWICEHVARAACTLWSRGSWLGGSLGFRIVYLLLPGSQIVVWHFVVCCFAFVLHCHTNPWGDTMLSSLRASSNCPWTDQLTTSRAGFCFCVCFVLFAFWCFCLFCLVLGFGVCFLSCTVTAEWIMYRSNSVLFCITLSLWTMLPLH